MLALLFHNYSNICIQNYKLFILGVLYISLMKIMPCPLDKISLEIWIYGIYYKMNLLEENLFLH